MDKKIKLPNKTKPKSLQDTFNRVWKHFIVEGNRKAVSPLGSCQYRDASGNGCVIGCLLPDHLAKLADQRGLSSIHHVLGDSNYVAVKKWLSTAGLLEALMDLQDIHDDNHSDYIIKPELKRFAKQWKLRVPVARKTTKQKTTKQK